MPDLRIVITINVLLYWHRQKAFTDIENWGLKAKQQCPASVLFLCQKSQNFFGKLTPPPPVDSQCPTHTTSNFGRFLNGMPSGLRLHALGPYCTVGRSVQVCYNCGIPRPCCGVRTASKAELFWWGRSFGSAPKTKMYAVLLYLKYEVVQMFALITLKFTALNETFKAHDD